VIDRDFSGSISQEELGNIFSPKVPDEDLKELFTRLKGIEEEISWSSFLFACLNSSLLSSGNL